MTIDLANSLGLKKTACHIPVDMLNTTSTHCKQLVSAIIKSRINNFEKKLTFLIVPIIAQSIPEQVIQRDFINIPKNIELADPAFHKPATVDVLLGSGPTLSSLAVGHISIKLPNEQLVYLQKTIFGWIIGGATPPNNLQNIKQSCHVTTQLEFDLNKFWELENYPNERKLTDEDQLCEEYFKATTTRTQEGRYVIALPFNHLQMNLGNSYDQALKRLENTERRLSHNPELQSQYYQVLNEYLELGHMSLITDTAQKQNHFLPHHAVIKESSTTTKVRIVFDGSAKTTTGISLNQTLFTGPTIQSDLFSLLIRFRKYPIVITGDIEKMYRQFLVREEDRNYQCILWRDAKDQLKEYQLNTVTFGLTPAPFLSIRCLHQLADDECADLPQIARIIKEDFYVNDVLTGAYNIQEAAYIRNQLTAVLSKARLSIRQWASNDIRALNNVPHDHIHKQLQLGDTPTVKTLGIFWNSFHDTISYSVSLSPEPNQITKRHILSETAKIFDPLGLLAPVIVIAKIMIQTLWNLKLHWDESLPQDLHTKWKKYYEELQMLGKLSFPRTIVTCNIKNVQLHGFSDASEKAYGACIYLRIINECDEVKIQLLCAKSRVAPLKKQTIPRLELCGAVLLSNLMQSVKHAIKMHIDQIFYWTDSTIVLHWINTESSRLKTFVANRISEIQMHTVRSNWRHVRTKDNPADLVSRGLLASEIVTSNMWKYGPLWLSSPESHWYHSEVDEINDLPEQRPATCLAVPTIQQECIFERFSTLTRLTRVLAYCFRFCKPNLLRKPITVEEIQSVLHRVINIIQERAFALEIQAI